MRAGMCQGAAVISSLSCNHKKLSLGGQDLGRLRFAEFWFLCPRIVSAVSQWGEGIPCLVPGAELTRRLLLPVSLG